MHPVMVQQAKIALYPLTNVGYGSVFNDHIGECKIGVNNLRSVFLQSRHDLTNSPPFCYPFYIDSFIQIIKPLCSPIARLKIVKVVFWQGLSPTMSLLSNVSDLRIRQSLYCC